MKEYLRERVTECLREIGIGGDLVPSFEKPRLAYHGDLTTNVAMVASKQVKMQPRKLAEQILERLKIDRSLVDAIEIAGPGFINFRFTIRFFQMQVVEILKQGEAYGKSSIGGGKKTQVEFVSANPTGPLTVGHGRGAVYGDTIARLLEWTNHNVVREYYFNDAGRQMHILGDSVRLRYLELLGQNVEFPDDYYQGEYICDIARQLYQEYNDKIQKEPADGMFKSRAEEEIFRDIKKTLKRLGIVHDVFYNEKTLYETGKVDEVIQELRNKGLVYEKDGAVWFKATQFKCEKDKVIVKGTGEPTYRLPDIAYHREKIRQGYELIIDVLGADHIAAYPDVLAGITALGYDASCIKVLIHQFVTIVQNGEVVKMSTRKANFITLDELIDDVGVDVVRYFFLMRSMSSHLNFDLNLARQQSEENPVYYLQYAHARIASIIRHAHQQGIEQESEPDVSLLTQPEEISLMKLLVSFPDVVESCAATYEPHRLAEYLHEVARSFHQFYQVHRVVTENKPLSSARLALCGAVKTVLANGFKILGISAPERM